VRRLLPKETALVLVDIQQKLAAAMPEPSMQALSRNVDILLEAAKRLGVPVLATEQYPKGLGPTLAPIQEKLANKPLEKLCFSAADDAAFVKALEATGAKQVVLAGMETHVCVFQTARALAEKMPTWVLRDAVTSRTEENRQAGLELCKAAGAQLTVTETVVFDWLKEAGSEDFKALSKLIR
jgi:nicotinamidase-related amidase